MKILIIDGYIVECTKVGAGFALGQRDWSYDIKIAKEGKHTAYMSMAITDNNPSFDLDKYEPSGEYVAKHAYEGFLKAMTAAKKKNYKFRIIHKSSMEKHFNAHNGRLHLNTDGKMKTYSFPFQTSTPKNLIKIKYRLSIK